MNLRVLQSLSSELEKISAASSIPLQKVSGIKELGTKALGALHKYEDPIEVAGLGVLAAPGVDSMIARHRARKAGLDPEDAHAVDQFRILKEKTHDPIEVGGLGVLAAPLLAKRMLHGSWTGH